MIKRLSNKEGVKNSQTLAGLREQVREYRNKTNVVIDALNSLLPESEHLRDVTNKSQCCNAPLDVVGGDEGTNYWACRKCGNASMPRSEEKQECKCPYLNDDCPQCYPKPQDKEVK